MLEVGIGFHPDSIKESDECWPAFQSGGLGLKFWALYKKNHITSQYFRASLEMLIAYFEKMSTPDSGVEPYRDIDQFHKVLRDCDIGVGREWLIKHWDYFNPNIQKKVALKYKAMVEVDQLMEIK